MDIGLLGRAFAGGVKGYADQNLTEMNDARKRALDQDEQIAKELRLKSYEDFKYERGKTDVATLKASDRAYENENANVAHDAAQNYEQKEVDAMPPEQRATLQPGILLTGAEAESARHNKVSEANESTKIAAAAKENEGQASYRKAQIEHLQNIDELTAQDKKDEAENYANLDEAKARMQKAATPAEKEIAAQDYYHYLNLLGVGGKKGLLGADGETKPKDESGIVSKAFTVLDPSNPASVSAANSMVETIGKKFAPVTLPTGEVKKDPMGNPIYELVPIDTQGENIGDVGLPPGRKLPNTNQPNQIRPIKGSSHDISFGDM